ncbi:acyltransferase domain-containing protein [Nocardiopsis alba]|uniref:acyltransferase domain-containing protein n=1 Tax=Nocardiopsis alba TaxID=53437 RepID=UPI0035DAAC15
MSTVRSGERGATVLLLPGQGTQYPRMAVGVYGADPVFRDTIEEFFTLAGRDGARWRRAWLTGRASSRVDESEYSQPLLFAVDLALATALRARGIEPDLLAGHSVGELTAAVLAGVFDLPVAVELMRERARGLAEAPEGGMVAVAASPEDVLPLLGDGVVVGAVNGPRQLLLCGSLSGLAAVRERLRGAGVVSRPAGARSAFHSPALNEVAERCEHVLSRARLRPPTVPIRSGRTGRPVTDAQARTPGFWTGQIAEPVLFGEALAGLFEDLPADGPPPLLVEAGPGGSLAALAARHRRGRGATILTALPSAPGGRNVDEASEAAAYLRLLERVTTLRAR